MNLSQKNLTAKTPRTANAFCVFRARRLGGAGEFKNFGDRLAFLASWRFKGFAGIEIE